MSGKASVPNVFASSTTVKTPDWDANWNSLVNYANDPTNRISFATDTGALNAYVLAPSPAVAYAGNFIVWMLPATSNTSSATAAINGLAALTIFKDSASGPIVLSGGEIVANNMVGLLFDSTLNSNAGGFHLLNPTTGVVSAQPSQRNLLVNARAEIDQRNEGASLTLSSGSAAFSADQWQAKFTQSGAAGTTAIRQVADSPTSFGGANGHSIKFTMGNGHATSAGDFGVIFQNIEAFKTALLVFGGATAQAISISFWIKCSLASPVFTVALQNSAASRSYLTNVTLGAANTWQQITIPNIPGDTSGTWLQNTNGIGLGLYLCFGAGSTFQGTNNTWQAGNLYGTSSTTNLMTTTGATVQITGVQVEIGALVTSLDNIPFDRDFVTCQRYYEKSWSPGTAVAAATHTDIAYMGAFGNGASNSAGGVSFKATKRAAATVSFWDGNANANKLSFRQAQTWSDNTGAPALVVAGQNAFIIDTGATSAVNFFVHYTADSGL